MKVVRFLYGDSTLWGKLDSDDIVFTSLSDFEHVNSFAEVIKIFEQAKDNPELLSDKINIGKIKLLAPVLPTKNILCIGKNYYDHILEFDGSSADVARVKETPIFFSKALSSIANPLDKVYLHENICDNVDYEAELAVVIGKEGINVKEDEALDYVYGYTILNDVTSRDLQEKHQQWFKGKSLDTHCPIGPWIVTTDEIQDGNNLKIQSYINGELRQDANTSLMMHDIRALIVQLSRGMTLNPGDIIATGTPKGVGKGFKPPRYLKAGDKMEVKIEGIGSLINTIASSLL